jgi:dTDP-glucose 4,6-dehydratase
MENSKDSVVNMDIMSYASNSWYLEQFQNSPKYLFIKDDINNVEKHKEELKDIDLIVNFAAESHVDNSINNSRPFLTSNIMGTHALLEYSRKNDIRFHQISTDEVFGALSHDSKDKFTVKTPYNPHNPYSASKASADMIVRSFHHTYGLHTTISNCSNNFGPHQHLEKLIPKTIYNAMNNISIPIYGDGRQIRDWIFVEDHNRAVETIVKKGISGNTYLIGNNGEIENITLVKKILKIMGKSESLIKMVKDRPGHDEHYAIDPSSSLELGWKPLYSFEKALNITIKHYMEKISHYIGV